MKIKRMMGMTSLFLASMAISAISFLAPANAFETSYKAEVVRVIDGDTIEVKIEVFPDLFQTIDVRERDLDTPEKRRGKFGAQCEAEVEAAIDVSKYVSELLPPGSIIGVENVDYGKYAGRTVGDIKLLLENGDTVDLGDHLIGLGMAVHYDGGTKKKVWCAATDGEQTQQPKDTG